MKKTYRVDRVSTDGEMEEMVNDYVTRGYHVHSWQRCVRSDESIEYVILFERSGAI